MSKIIYIVQCEGGEYEDRYSYIVQAWETAEQAVAHKAFLEVQRDHDLCLSKELDALISQSAFAYKQQTVTTNVTVDVAFNSVEKS